MIQTIDVVLTAHYPGGRQVAAADFIDRLSLGGYEGCPSVGPGQSARIIFLRSKSPPFGGPDDALAHFESGVQAELLRAAEWLARQPKELFTAFAARSLKLTLFADMWIDGDQMDLTLPPELLFACGERGIEIHVITND